jgi:hypothetical protein
MPRIIALREANPVTYNPDAPDLNKPFYVSDKWYSRDELTIKGMDDYCYTAVDTWLLTTQP